MAMFSRGATVLQLKNVVHGSNYGQPKHLLTLFDSNFSRSTSKDVFIQARSAADRWEVAHSAFLTPPVLNDALIAVRKLSDVGALVSGGYAQVPSLRRSF